MAKDVSYKPKTDLVDDMVDEAPAKGPPSVAVMAPPPAVLAKAAPPAPPVVEAPPVDDRFPWGYLVKHPSFGTMRVRKDEAASDGEAIEVYRKKKCPHMKTAQLTDSGMRIAVLKFTPAATEKGK